MSINPLKDQLTEDVKTYLKGKNQKFLNFTRMLLSEVKNAEINNRETFTPDMAVKAVSLYVKKLQKSLEDFKSDPNRFAILEEEIAFCQKYLPKALSDDEIRFILNEITTRLNGEKNFSVMMREAMKELGSRADGQKIQTLLKEILK